MKHGEGSVTERADGRFWARLPDPKRTSLGLYATEADAWAAIAHARRIRAKRGAPAGETFEAFGRHVLDLREEDGIRGIDQERNRFEFHLATSHLASRGMADILPLHIADFVRAIARKNAADKRGKRKISHKTVGRCLSLVSVIFDEAILRGIRPDNPCAGVKLRRKQAEAAETEEPWDYLRRDEQLAIAKCEAIPEWARCLMRFAWGTGLRQGEQWNLELRDLHVDPEDPEVKQHGPHVFVRFGSQGKRAKNAKTRRVPLFGDGLEAARRWLEILPTWVEKDENGKRNTLKLVFPTLRGCRRGIGAPSRTTYDPKTKTRGKAELLAEWLAAAGVKREIRWHDLRHTCASALVSGMWGRRWSLEEVCAMLGHSSIIVTQRYAHLAESALTQAARETPGIGYGLGTDLPILHPRLLEMLNRIAAVGPEGIEPSTYGLKVRSSTD